jgi:hypothetical protein
MGQPLLVGGRVVGQVRHQHLLGDAGGWLVAVQRLQDAIDETAGRQVFHLVEHEPLAAHDAPLANEEHLHRCFEFVVGQADEVEVFVAVGHHLLLLDRALDRCQPVAQTGGALELQLLGRTAHLELEPGDDLVGVAVEELAQLGDELAVRHLRDLADARAAAFLDVEQQARPPEPVVFVELAGTAGAHRKAAQQQVERLADGVGVRIRPEVAHTLALAATHHHRPRVLLVERHGQERVALVVAQADVEPRPVLLDEAVLEHERLDLVAHLDPLDRLGRRHHLCRTRVQVARVLEVVRQPLAQARRLAHVDDATLRIFELVRARRIGNRAGRRSRHHAVHSRAPLPLWPGDER